MVAAGADVARDLRELVDRHEDLVRALELEVQVVAGDAGDGLGVEAGEARQPVVLVDDDVAGAQVGEGAEQPAAAAGRALDPAAAGDQLVLGDRGELQRRRDEAVPEIGLGEHEAAVAVPPGPEALEVVGGALALAALRPRDERRVARARELLELRLGLVERACGELGGLGAELDRLRAGDAGEAQRLPRDERLRDRVGRHVEVVRVGVVEGGADVVPVIAQRGLEVLIGGDHDVGVLGEQREQLAEAVDREQLGDVGAALLVLERGDLRELAVLGGELGGGRDLDALPLAQRALGEGREPAQRLDLDVEQLDADRALLGRGVDVEQAAADRELAAVLDLVDALVAGRDELQHGLVEVEQLADLEREAVRAQLGIGDLLGERDGGDHDHRRFVARRGLQNAVQGRDPEPYEVWRRREVRLVGDAAARVEPHRARLEPRAQVGGEVARRAVVAGDHHGRAPHVAVRDRRDQERPERLRDERARARGLELRGVRVLLEMAEERAERHPRRVYDAAASATRSAHASVSNRPRGTAAGTAAQSTGPQSSSARSRASPRIALPGSVAGSSGMGPTPKACTNQAVSSTPAWTWKPSPTRSSASSSITSSARAIRRGPGRRRADSRGISSSRRSSRLAESTPAGPMAKRSSGVSGSSACQTPQ